MAVVTRAKNTWADICAEGRRGDALWNNYSIAQQQAACHMAHGKTAFA